MEFRVQGAGCRDPGLGIKVHVVGLGLRGKSSG